MTSAFPVDMESLRRLHWFAGKKRIAQRCAISEAGRDAAQGACEGARGRKLLAASRMLTDTPHRYHIRS
ncbi:MAG: hypothetical protein HQ483_12760 [Rhodospirillales bacterium]|nr:hypothetical protein [Rhodospirillales bacterium]